MSKLVSDFWFLPKHSGNGGWPPDLHH